MYIHLLYGRDVFGADGLMKLAHVISNESSSLSNTDRNLKSMLASTRTILYEAASLNSLRSGICNPAH